MRQMGFLLHPTKRAGPLQIIEFIGFVIDYVNARLSLTVHRCDSIRAQVAELLNATELGKRWLVADFDSLMGKLAHAVYVLRGGRVALCPMYEIRSLAARHWPDPQGKPPRYASLASSEDCVRGLKWWWQALAVFAPPSVDLFVYPDGSLDVWGPHIIRDPYVIQRPLVQEGLGCGDYVRRVCIRRRFLRRQTLG